jgi:hypothetical protein
MSEDFCFGILALTSKYQLLAKKCAEDLEKYFPETTVVIGTDNPYVFQDCNNVFAFKMKKNGILHCYHDKRFVLEKALEKFKTAIFIDADTKIIDSPATSFKIELPTEGIHAMHVANLIQHMQYYTPERLYHFKKLSKKLEIDLNSASFVGESLFAVSVEGNKTSEFFRQWDSIASYLQLHGIHAGAGNAIGLAAAKAGLEITKPPWLKSLNQVTHHFDASHGSSKKTSWDFFKNRLSYHYRLNKARIIALKDFNFYYR